MLHKFECLCLVFNEMPVVVPEVVLVFDVRPKNRACATKN